MKKLLKDIIGILLFSIAVFCVFVTISFLHQTLPAYLIGRATDAEIHIGIPFEMFEQFFISDCLTPHRAWFGLGIILNLGFSLCVGALCWWFFNKWLKY